MCRIRDLREILAVIEVAGIPIEILQVEMVPICDDEKASETVNPMKVAVTDCDPRGEVEFQLLAH